MSAAHSMVDLLSASKALGQIITPIIVLGTIDYDNGNSLYPTQPWGVRQRALNSHCSWAFIPWIMSYCSCCYRKDHLNLREAPFYIFFTIRHQMPFVWYYHAIQRNQKRFILLLADFEDSVSDGPHVSPPMLLPRGLSTHDPKLSIHKHPRTFLDWRALTLQLKASVYAPPISRLANKKNRFLCGETVTHLSMISPHMYHNVQGGMRRTETENPFGGLTIRQWLCSEGSGLIGTTEIVWSSPNRTNFFHKFSSCINSLANFLAFLQIIPVRFWAIRKGMSTVYSRMRKIDRIADLQPVWSVRAVLLRITFVPPGCSCPPLA